MKILIVSQVFWPDNVAVSLFVTDLANKLVERGHQVHVIAGRYDYEDHKKKYALHENHQGLHIIRLKNSGLGKSNTFYRLFDFFTFNLLVFLKLLRIRKKSYDLVICSTVPPMLPFITSLFAKKIANKFFYWVMDIQPELSINSGMIRPNSLVARLLVKMGDFVFRKADHVFVLDKFMKENVKDRLGNISKITISPLWPVLEKHYNGNREDNPFRIKHQFQDKIVIMYSGNHSYIHPIKDLLQAALSLKNEPDFIFVFVGSGVRKKEVLEFKAQHQLSNIVSLPFEPRELAHISLSAADFQVVIMGDRQVGYTHPNKIYGALFLGKPVIYIGPSPSHVTEILDQCPGNILIEHGNGQKLAQEILRFSSNKNEMNAVGQLNGKFASQHLDPDVLKNEMADQVVGLANS